MDFLTYLRNIVKCKEEKISELRTKIENATTADEVRSLSAELTVIEKELLDATSQIKDFENKNISRSNGIPDSFNPDKAVCVGNFDMGNSISRNATKELEERKAFQQFIGAICKGKNVRSYKQKYIEARSAAGNVTDADGVGTVIPENLVNDIIRNIEDLGKIYNLVTKTSYPVGQTIPVESLRPVATWVGRNSTTPASSTTGEGEGSTVQKGVTLDTAITFTHFKLRCEVAMSEEVSVMALPVFERLFIDNVSTAMLRAIEFAIVDGDGYGMPTGILNSTVISGNNIDIASNKQIDFKTLTTAEGLIPADKEYGTKWCMSKKTFMSFVGMLDSVGQPIARVNYGLSGKIERTLLGRDVVIYTPQTGSKLGNYSDTVASDTIFAFLFDFNDYILNNNYDLGIQSKIDWDNEDHRVKAVAAYDGKVVDNRSLITITKKSS